MTSATPNGYMKDGADRLGDTLEKIIRKDEITVKVKLTILESKCRGNYHKAEDIYIVDDICPPICHELWQCIYPSIYTLLNNGDLDYGNIKAKKFQIRCPDNGRVLIQGEVIND